MFMDGKIHNVFSSESIYETLLSGSNSDCGENSFFNTACYEVISKYHFVENSSNITFPESCSDGFWERKNVPVLFQSSKNAEMGEKRFVSTFDKTSKEYRK